MLIYAAIGAFGLLFLLVMLFVGDLFGADHEIHVGDHGEIGGHEGGPGVFSARIMASFLTAFGVGGIVARYYGLSHPAAAGCGVVAGVVMSGAVYQFAKILYSQQASSEVQMTRLVGKTGEVTEGRRRDPAGNGGRRHRAARRFDHRGARERHVSGGFSVNSLIGGFSAVTIAFAVLLGLLGIFAAMALFARNYIKVPPSQVAIFYGRKHTLVDEKGDRTRVGFRVVRGGAALRVPVLEQVAYLSLNIISIPLKIQRAYTKEGVPVTVEAVANVKIAGDDMSLRSAAERFLGMTVEQIKGVIFQTLEGHLRAILGTLTVEEINADRQAFAQKMTDEAAVDLKKMGVNIDILTIQQISDEEGYLDALGKKRTAEVKRDAVIGEALAQRDAMIQSANADQEGKTKRYEADVTIAQSLRDKETKQAEFNAAVQGKQAEAQQSGPLATAIAKQKVTEQETRIDQVRKAQEVLVQEQEALRKEKELQATVVKPAEAERQAAILRAEGEKQATIIKAEATQKELEYEGAGEAAKIEKVGRAEAARVLAVGEAEAEVIKKKLLAEAEGLQKKSEAWKNFNEAAVLNMIVEKMPELAQAFATQLAGIDKINIIDMGSGANGGGVGKLMGTVGGGMTAMLAMLKDQFGIDIARLVQAKTDAAAAEAESRPAPGGGKKSA
jgi:flotillin